MLKRKIEHTIDEHLASCSDKVLIIEGARQIGKSFIVRHVCRQRFAHYVEINLADDYLGERRFEQVRTTEMLYLQVSIAAAGKVGNANDTIVFLDEIQTYPHLLTMLKFLRQEGRYTFIASGSLLGVTLHQSTSIPIGSIRRVQMYPLDFEEFLWANGCGDEVVEHMRQRYLQRRSLDVPLHETMLSLFKKYLITGGMPDAVNTFVETKNIVAVRNLQTDIHALYGIDASKYDRENRLKIRRVFDLIPSLMENKKKRIVAKDIEQKEQARFKNYQNEFDYLISSGIALDVKAISNPRFPLLESAGKNLLKLYLNDVGLLTNLLYRTNIQAVLGDEKSVNLGAVYESVVAQELKAHGHNLFYYDNKKHGEVDYLVDDFDRLSVLPIEVKSGKDFTVHSALSHFLATPDYYVREAVVLSNEREVQQRDSIVYMPIYYILFI